MIPKGPKGPFRCLGGDKMMNLVIHIIAGNLRSVGPPKEEWPQLTKAATHKGTNLRKGPVPNWPGKESVQANSSSYDWVKTKVWWNQLWSPPKTWVYPTVIAKSIYKSINLPFSPHTKANDSHDDRLLWRVGSFCSPQFLATLPLRYILKGRLFFEKNGENWRICIDLNGFAGFKRWYFEITLPKVPKTHLKNNMPNPVRRGHKIPLVLLWEMLVDPFNTHRPSYSSQVVLGQVEALFQKDWLKV